MKEGWEYGTINDFCNVNYGTRVVRRNVTGDKYPVYGGGGETFRMDEYNREDCLVVARFAMSKQCTRIVKGKFFLNDSGLTVSPKESSGLDAKLLDRYLLASNDLIYSYGRGSAQINLNVDEFRNMPLSFPKSLSEQQRIVDYLDAAFAKIDAMKANAEKSLNEAKALFQAALKEMLEPKEVWEEKKLEDIVDSNCPISYGIVQQGDHIEGGVPVVRPVDLNQKYVSVDRLKCTTQSISSSYKRTILRGDEILLGVRGTTGIVGIATDNMKGFNVNRGIVPLFFKDGIYRDFIYYEMLSPAMQSVFAEKTTGSTLKQINIKDLRKICFSYPLFEVQQSIVATLDSLKSKVDRLQANFEKISQECDALKQAILRQVFE